MIHKAIIPAAGLGTRLLPATKEQPKEMLPVFSRVNSEVVVKPILQVVFEKVYNSGIREFCFITGKTKRAIEDHFLPNTNSKECLQPFNNMLLNSKLFWVNQHEPKGFGHAVLQAKNFAGNDDVLVHAGDTLTLTQEDDLQRLFRYHEKYNADVTLIVEKVPDARRYGIIIGQLLEDKVYKVQQLIEKPPEPPSNLAITAMYIFKPIIFKALEKTKPDAGNEIQLTDAIQMLVNWGMDVIAVEMHEGEKRIDIGTAETYKDALEEVM
jgi:UTP--glucose-1-phosphate uridylyltransferase